jgi:hypothetical protein
MLCSQFFATFANFRQIWVFFSKTNDMIKFLKKLAVVWAKTPIFRYFFGENIYKILTSERSEWMHQRFVEMVAPRVARWYFFHQKSQFG